MATVSLDKTVRIWGLAQGKALHILEGHIGAVVSAAFSPDRARLATASWDRTVKVWDVQTGLELITLGDFAEEVTHVTFSGDGNQLAANSRAAIKIWDGKGTESPEMRKERRYLWRAEQALAAQAAQHWFAAAFHLSQILHYHPDEPRWLRMRSQAYGELGLPDKARADLDKVNSMTPKSVPQ